MVLRPSGAAAASRFDPIDFEQREHVAHSGWPISYDEVARFYEPALKECEAGAFQFGEDALLSNESFIEGFETAGGTNNSLEAGLERYSPRRTSRAATARSCWRSVTCAS